MNKHVHFLGIGGSGASANAAIAQAHGWTVTGCDKNPHNEFTKGFSSDQLKEGHDATHLDGVDILAVTPAIYSLDPNNPELVAAKDRGIEVMTWQQFMGKYLEEGRFVIAVCGTHGKSTTTAMIGLMLEDAGLDPTVELGAVVPRWGSNYRVGKSKYFVTEADEFNDNFLATTPDIAVVTTVEMDHPEFFDDFEDYKESFDEFLGKTRGTIVANMTDSGVSDVTKYVIKQHGTTVLDYTKSDFGLDLQVLGEHNRKNANAAFEVGLLLGIDPAVIRQSLNNFPGIGRRIELLGEKKGATVYSSFGHHPTEIKMDVLALREKYSDSRLIMIFQPHMFSRTKALFEDFVSTLRDLPVHHTYIADIYPSREVDTGLVTSKQLVEAIDKNTVEYILNWSDLRAHLDTNSTQGDIVVFMGAGDTDKWAREFLKESSD
jgi:UDP-N-acetylmuramate--alanine ligase